MNEVINFLKEHKNIYSKYFEKDRLLKCLYGYTCDINQIYCYLNLIDIKESEYYSFYLLCSKFFDLTNKKVLEVGCGYIPILSSIFKKNSINIDAVNNMILIKDYNGIHTIEADLSKSYNLHQYDLIIGFRPCNITENVIDLCYKYKKDFMIYLCPCIHKPKNIKNDFNTYKQWVNYLIHKINKFENYKISIIKNHKMPDDCPVLIGKKIKI